MKNTITIRFVIDEPQHQQHILTLGCEAEGQVFIVPFHIGGIGSTKEQVDLDALLPELWPDVERAVEAALVDISFEEFARIHDLCLICAGSGIDPLYDTGSPDDLMVPCPKCGGD